MVMDEKPIVTGGKSMVNCGIKIPVKTLKTGGVVENWQQVVPDRALWK